MGAQLRNEQPNGQPPRQAVLDQLEKLLSSPAFQGAERSRTLLRFLVEQTIEGHSDRLKEYTLATQALGRSVAFDPRSDPIVRAEASRLRDRLSRYYAGEGRTEPLVIGLPKGSYVPRFECRTASPSSLKVGEQPLRRMRLAWLALTFAAAASIVAVLLWGFAGVTRPSGEVSIAVLPLANISLAPGREFFADGVTDEIAAALARVPNLKVVGRSSAYAFKNQSKPAREIGQALGATHFIEGSVRQDEGRVRIAVQLTRTDNGLQLWSAVYDRKLTDIFTVQEEIARSVTASLNVALGLKPGENLVNNRSIDPDSYEEYLHAKALFLARGGVPAAVEDRNLAEAATLLEGVVAKNPTYAPAWAFLGGTFYGLASNSNRAANIVNAGAVANEFRIKGEAAAQRSLQLDPNLAAGYDALAVFVWSRAKLLEADGLFEKAVVLDPTEPNVLGAYAIRLGSAGRLKEALGLAERAYRVDPLYPNLARATVEDRWLNGQTESAIGLAKTLRASDRASLLSLIYASMGRYNEAADALVEVASDPNSPAAQTARLLRAAPAKTAAPEALPQLPASLEFVYLHVGAPERALDAYEHRAESGFLAGNLTALLWHPSYAPVRKTDRFKALMRKVGLVEYWRAKGWPPQCHPTNGDDFTCN